MNRRSFIARSSGAIIGFLASTYAPISALSMPWDEDTEWHTFGMQYQADGTLTFNMNGREWTLTAGE
jgi:hypothetical protein